MSIMNKFFKDNPDFYILFFNVPAVLYIVETEHIPKKLIGWLIGLFLAICIMGLLTLYKKIGLFNFFRNLQVSIGFFVILIFLAQGLYMVFPSVYPRFIINMTESPKQTEIKGKIVDLLDQSPFAKPKPNVLIHVPGDYGNKSNFEYEWITDNRGYKNDHKLALKDQFDVIALGDSFTEGMGVKIEDTWVAKLNALGINAYSLGVQGYAPSQMNGTFKLFGAKLYPKLVIVGYLTSTYDREKLILENRGNKTNEGELPSAIGRLVEYNNDREYRGQFKFVISSALFIIGKQTLNLYRSYIDPVYSRDPRFIPEKLMMADKTISLGQMQRYKQEMEQAAANLSSKAKIESSPEWQKTLSALKEIASGADKIGAKTMLLIFHNRGPIYINKATGQNLKENYQGYIEREFLKKFSAENGLLFLDTERALIDYIKDFDDMTDMAKYPYLKYDGHLSKRGNEIIANLVADYIKDNRLLEP